MRLAAVCGRPDGQLEIHFADGSVVVVDGRRLLPARTSGVHWAAAHLGEYGFEIVLPRDDGADLGIPWDVIRSLTDRDFASYLARAAEEQARTVGTKLRALRQARKLTAREVAARADITPQSLYRIEYGKHDVVLTTLGKILAAMGYSYRDLVVADDGDTEDALAALAGGR